AGRAARGAGGRERARRQPGPDRGPLPPDPGGRREDRRLRARVELRAGHQAQAARHRGRGAGLAASPQGAPDGRPRQTGPSRVRGPSPRSGRHVGRLAWLCDDPRETHTRSQAMKLCYALRRGVYYPSQRDAFGEMPAREHRARYLKYVKESGFEGVEIPAGGSLAVAATEELARDLGAELRDAGVPAVCVRGGGPIAHPREGKRVRERMAKVVDFAGWIGASVVNTTIVTPATHPNGPGSERRGEPVSQ